MAKPDRATKLKIVRAKIMADPNTPKLAKAVGMTLEEYVDQTMIYVANPKMQPMVRVIPDAELRAAGHNPPDIKEMVAFVKEHYEAQQMTQKSKFADPNSQREKVSGKIPTTPAPTAEPDEVRSDLKEELDRERSSGKFKKF